MKLKGREFVDRVDAESLPLLEQWAMRQRGLLAVYQETNLASRKRVGQTGQRYRLEKFVEDLGEVDDSIYAVLVGQNTHPVARSEAAAYSQIEFFEPIEEIAEFCRDAMGQ